MLYVFAWFASKKIELITLVIGIFVKHVLVYTFIRQLTDLSVKKRIHVFIAYNLAFILSIAVLEL